MMCDQGSEPLRCYPVQERRQIVRLIQPQADLRGSVENRRATVFAIVDGPLSIFLSEVVRRRSKIRNHRLKIQVITLRGFPEANPPIEHFDAIPAPHSLGAPPPQQSDASAGHAAAEMQGAMAAAHTAPML
jgi:hypothetical protein